MTVWSQGEKEAWDHTVFRRESWPGLVPGHLENVSSPVIEGILVGRRRDVLGRQPDAAAVRVGLGEGVVTPAGLVERRRVGEAQVRSCPCGHRGDLARP